jgi:hypothetical protein
VRKTEREIEREVCVRGHRQREAQTGTQDVCKESQVGKKKREREERVGGGCTFSSSHKLENHTCYWPKVGHIFVHVLLFSEESPGLDTMPDAKGRTRTRTLSQTFTIPLVSCLFHSVALVAPVAFSLSFAYRLDGRVPPPTGGQGLGVLEGIEVRERKEASPIDWLGLASDNLVDDLSTSE